MIQKKVCMLGAFATGKTSLVSRFVHSIFSEKYLTTVGVKIDRKPMELGDRKLLLIVWDLHGEDEFQKVRMSYLRGSSGYILVADGTRQATLDKACLLQQEAEQALGHVPFVLALNKSDLVEEWEVSPEAVQALTRQGWQVIQTSAKTDMGVHTAFQTLAEKMMEVA
jgi:small GTP-binding protein